jgi:hypothetical protein
MRPGFFALQKTRPNPSFDSSFDSAIAPSYSIIFGLHRCNGQSLPNHRQFRGKKMKKTFFAAVNSLFFNPRGFSFLCPCLSVEAKTATLDHFPYKDENTPRTQP